MLLFQTSIDSLSSYLSAIKQLKEHYPTAIFSRPAATSFLYRGVSSVEYHLIPGILREDSKPKRNKKYTEFGAEQGILNSFIHEASAYLSIPPTNKACWLEYAQHYGVPTRLLDWSSNPLVALYFCCKGRPDSDGITWVLHAPNYVRFIESQPYKAALIGKTFHDRIRDLLDNSSRENFPFIYTPYYSDLRMSAQRSYFMVWGTEETAFDITFFSDESEEPNDHQMKLDSEENLGDERVFGEHARTAFLFKFLVPCNRKPFIIRELDMVGINEKTLFPGLDGIGRYIEQKFSFNYDELIESI